MNEEWRPVLKLAGLYEISNCGSVRRTLDKRTKATPRNSSGYALFAGYFEHRQRSVYVHRAVAEAFIGPCPAGLVVNHKDGDKTNNVVENLEYTTYAGNSDHARNLGLLPTGEAHWAKRRPDLQARGDRHWTHQKPDRVARGDANGARLHPERILRGEACPASRLTAADVLEIRRLSSSGLDDLSLSGRFGVTRRNINRIVNGQSWKHVQ